MAIEFVKQQTCIVCGIEKPLTSFNKSRNEGEYIDLCKKCQDTRRESKQGIKAYHYKKKDEADGSWMGGGDGWAHI